MLLLNFSCRPHPASACLAFVVNFEILLPIPGTLLTLFSLITEIQLTHPAQSPGHRCFYFPCCDGHGQTAKVEVVDLLTVPPLYLAMVDRWQGAV